MKFVQATSTLFGVDVLETYRYLSSANELPVSNSESSSIIFIGIDHCHDVDLEHPIGIDRCHDVDL